MDGEQIVEILFEVIRIGRFRIISNFGERGKRDLN